jgi:hypothetical protein
MSMRKVGAAATALALGACASNALPPPNTMQSRFDPKASAVRVLVSDLQPLSSADLLAPDGSRYPAAAVTLLSGPHVDYGPPPSIGIGVGGFGSGVGVGLPTRLR